MDPSEQIQQAEQRLLTAMLNDDISELDSLLSDELLVTGPDGRLADKKDDLEAHISGEIRIRSMVPLESKIKYLPDLAIVFVLMDMTGNYQGQPFAGGYRYTRVWQYQNNTWQVIAAHISVAAE